MAKSPLIPIDMARTGMGSFTFTFHKDLMTAGDTDAVLARYNARLKADHRAPCRLVLAA